MNHKIYIRRDKGVKSFLPARSLLRRCITCVLASENVAPLCELNVLLTDDRRIQEINREMRHVDSPTDVLSFPMNAYRPGAFTVQEDQLDPQTGLLPLGDLVMSMDRLRAQGTEFEHGLKREMAYLAVHSVLHLLGYDHLDEGEDKLLMRRREDEIMAKLNLT